MADGTALDDAFDQAFEHLSECRTAWEKDPRDPACIDALGKARAALEDARAEMRAERKRFAAGYEPHVVDGPRVDADPSGDWKGMPQA